MRLRNAIAGMTEPLICEHWWTVQRGPGPIVATAIHDGHDLRPEVAAAMRLPDADRFREEDPFTGQAIADVPTHIVAHRSRFEFDLNRGPGDAVYETPEQCWGLKVWHERPGRNLVERSLAIHAAYYRMLGALLDDIAAGHDQFVVFDVHSYNHRRGGPDGEATAQADAPDINIGTFSMPREEWSFLVDPLMEAMRGFDFNGRRLDVRENVAFQGKGEQTRFVHDRYPGRGCAIALEFKKFFMDEWTGIPDDVELHAIRRFIAFTADTALDLLQ
jgi:N-formylglutamate amidohydrolase